VVGSVRDDGEKKSQERLLMCHNRKLIKLIANPSLLYITIYCINIFSKKYSAKERFLTMSI
jgi:hypothetical protein